MGTPMNCVAQDGPFFFYIMTSYFWMLLGGMSVRGLNWDWAHNTVKVLLMRQLIQMAWLCYILNALRHA